MNFTLLVKSVVLFNYICKLMINNAYYHQSIGWNKMAFMMQPGVYVTNADHIKVVEGVDHLLFSGNMKMICGGAAEEISYYHWLKHDVWIVWGGGTLWYDDWSAGGGESGGVIVKREEAGWHSVRVDVDKCHDPKLLKGGRFLEIWVVNITKKFEIDANVKGYRFNPLLLYNAEHISTY